MCFLSFPANVGFVGRGSGEAKNLAGKRPPPLIQIRFSDAEFGKISPAGQRKSTVRFNNGNSDCNLLSLRPAKKMRELSTLIGWLSPER